MTRGGRPTNRLATGGRIEGARRWRVARGAHRWRAARTAARGDGVWRAALT